MSLIAGRLSKPAAGRTFLVFDRVLRTVDSAEGPALPNTSVAVFRGFVVEAAGSAGAGLGLAMRGLLAEGEREAVLPSSSSVSEDDSPISTSTSGGGVTRPNLSRVRPAVAYDKL